MESTIQVAQPQNKVAVIENNPFANAESFALIQRIGQTFSNSDIVPSRYRMQSENDKKALSNCIIAVDMAQRMNANPLMVMQNLYVVNGNPGWSSKFLIACLNGCGKFSALRYEQENENTEKWRCRAYAYDKTTGDRLDGSWVSIEMAKKEGWFSKIDKTGKETSKWQTMPELMLQYRAAAFFQRVYAPEISMGMQTAEELEDIEDVTPVDVTPRTVSPEVAAQGVVTEEQEAEVATLLAD